MKKLLRQASSEGQQLALQLDFFSADFSALPPIDSPAPQPDVRQPAPALDVTATPPGPGRRRIQLNDYLLEYGLQRTKRRSIGFTIGSEGLRIAAPKWVTIAEIESAIREKQRWIFAKLSEQRERSARRLHPPMQWRHGATLPYLGGELMLRIAPEGGSGVRYDALARELTISLPSDAGEQQIKDRVLGWLQQEARRVFSERLPLYAEKLGVQYQSFALTSAMTQWGSCTADGRIRLNWRLMHFAPAQIDYVIAHELAHLREMNHGPRFWAAVQSVFPEFEAARKALRDHAPETLPEF